jgi:hypothetical protein
MPWKTLFLVGRCLQQAPPQSHWSPPDEFRVWLSFGVFFSWWSLCEVFASVASVEGNMRAGGDGTPDGQLDDAATVTREHELVDDAALTGPATDELLEEL